MKTVKSGGEIRRVEDNEATDMVKRGWAYCAKSEWKTKVRATAKPTTVANPDDESAPIAVVKANKKQKRKNEKLIEKLVGSEPKKKGKKEKTA